MNKRFILLGFILFGLAVAVFAVFLRGKIVSENMAPAVIAGQAELVLLENGLYEITYPSSNVSFQVSEKWNPVAFNDVERGVTFGTSDLDGNTIMGFFTYFKDPSLFSVESFREENPGYWFEISESGEVTTLYYLGNGSPPFAYEWGDDEKPDPLEENSADVVTQNDSYVTGKLIISKDSAIRIDCQLSGPSYSGYISLCNNVVNSLIVN